MKRAQLVPMVLLAALCGVAVVGCDRAVVGETYEGQLAGGRSLQVTADSPPRGAMTADAPEVPPPSQREWTVRESDPSIRGLLTASGARIPFRDAPRPRPVAPPPPPPPMPVAPTAVVVPPAPAPAPAAAPQIVRPIRALAPRPAAPAAAAPAAAPAPAAQP